MNTGTYLFILAFISAHIIAEAAEYQHTFADEQTGQREIVDSRNKYHHQRMLLWARGDTQGRHVDYRDIYSHPTEHVVQRIEEEVAFASLRLGPVRNIRKEFLHESSCIEFECESYQSILSTLRGGGGGGGGGNDAHDRIKSYNERLQFKLHQLADKYGPEFQHAIELNEKDHAEDCEISCQSFYCAPNHLNNTQDNLLRDLEKNGTSFISYNFGAIPPEDFAEEFGFPLDIIKVSNGQPLFSPQEALNVIQTAEQEGVDKNEYKSGKYKLGGDWLVNLPKTRAWFNEKLETTFFPLLTQLFPEVISSSSVLRAHSVSLLKYNSSHPRTDVHIDNGILAITVAMTPQDEYSGGGTFFEHMPKPLHMDVGHVTMRPGSVRHGGHKVTKGTRYILGAFLLIKDRVEHVRRLKNRGSELRKKQDLSNAAKHFEWALAINPKCTTCLKDWAEILMTEKDFPQAELKIREALRLLENRDSDALFSLGIILSEAGKDDESIDAYTKSIELNADDAELCYNLGIKLGEKRDKKGEMTMYAHATQVDPQFGGAWLNWGTSLAEVGNMEDVCQLINCLLSIMFCLFIC